MGTRAAAIAAVVMVTGCGSYGSEAFHCDNDHACTGGAVCETNGFCSLTDASCESGRRFTDHSGALSGTCVGGGPPIDSGIDAPPDGPPPPDARVCFGTGIVQVCLATAPTKSFTTADLTTIDTSDPSMCAMLTSGGNYCVIAATNIMLGARLRATGPKPLVLLSTDSITTTAGAVIDVGSHRIRPVGTSETGAGADPATCGAGTAPTNGGGGAGGSFIGLGGNGGNGNSTANTGGVPGPVVTGAVTELRGGCPGQNGQGAVADRGDLGHGGGAVFLIALNKIDIGGGIDAGGEGGAAGVTNASGGGGGGAGGMIGFDAPMITVTSLLLANGGAGGEGSGMATKGADGTDATATTAAQGGSGNTSTGGDGGNGSAGATSAGGAGNTGSNGGGGGGGGAGLIKAPATASLGTMVSPPATP